VLAFEPDLLNQGDMTLPGKYAELKCQGNQKKYAYQTNKKLYAARALRPDKWMVMDDETAWSKPTSITSLFRQHWGEKKQKALVLRQTMDAIHDPAKERGMDSKVFATQKDGRFSRPGVAANK
jgi:hypothetical protein